MKRRWRWLIPAALVLVAESALAQRGPRDAGPSGAGSNDAGAAIADAGSASAPGDAGSMGDAGSIGDAGAGSIGDAGPSDAGSIGDAGAVAGTCVEHVPNGVARPLLIESLPARGVAGYAIDFTIRVTHGKGETVLPEGLRPSREGAAGAALAKSGFVIPDPSGGAAGSITLSPEGDQSITTVRIALVPLPKEAGRQMLTLPPLPISIARANGDRITLCTKPQSLLVEEPIANEPDPKVKPNPPARPQREEWVLLKQVLIGLGISALAAIAGFLLARALRKKPEDAPPPPKPIPWVAALEELERIRRSTLLEEDRRGEYFDRVSNTIRFYLGARYGFEELEAGYNGLETTTSEMLEMLRRVRPPIDELKRIRVFLEDCDLVKFARAEPTKQECLDALARGEVIVKRTIPPAIAEPVGGPNEGANEAKRRARAAIDRDRDRDEEAP